MMDVIKILTNMSVMALTIIGVLAFLVSVITEVTKNIGIFKKIPTDLQVIVLSIILCVVSYLAYTSYASIAVIWYYVVGCIIAAFIVSFIAMYGWAKLTALYNRFKK